MERRVGTPGLYWVFAVISHTGACSGKLRTVTNSLNSNSWKKSAVLSCGRDARPSLRPSLCPLLAPLPGGSAAQPRGPLGAPGRAAGRPRAFLAGEESPAGALRGQLAARGPARSAGSWGRSLARPPPQSQALAFCAATLPEPFGEARRPRARSAPLLRESLSLWAGRAGETSRRRSGALGQLRPRRKATPREPSAIAPGL